MTKLLRLLALFALLAVPGLADDFRFVGRECYAGTNSFTRFGVLHVFTQEIGEGIALAGCQLITDADFQTVGFTANELSLWGNPNTWAQAPSSFHAKRDAALALYAVYLDLLEGGAPATLTIATSSPLPSGTLSTAYAQKVIASGGTAPYLWDLASGSVLPAGLTLQNQVLNEPDFATHDDWDATGDFTDSTGEAVYTDSAGSGTLTQATANQAVVARPLAVYRFTYTTSGLSGDVACTITTAFAGTSTAVPLSNGAHILAVTSGATPGDFVLSCTSTSGGVTFDDLSLTTGDILGTPSVAGQYAFTLQVTDAAAVSTTKLFSLSVLGGQVAGNFVDAEVPTGTLDGVNLVFTLSQSPNPAASVILTRNGLVLKAGTDYSVSTNEITFAVGSPPQAGDLLLVWFRH